MSRKRERENPCFICNHYHNYDAGEVCNVCGHAPPCATAPPAALPSAFPTEVLHGFLYLGSYDHASRAELLKAMGIQRILNVRARAPRRAARARLPAPDWHKGFASATLAREGIGGARAQPRSRAAARALTLVTAPHASRAAQTVPSCQNLYRNTFTYWTASAVPGAPKQVPLDECVAFIGMHVRARARVHSRAAAAAVCVARCASSPLTRR